MRAKRSLGQNFLNDSSVIERIVSSLKLTEDDTVVEIGPGRGSLTETIVKSGANVIAIEIDRLLVPVLRTQFHFDKNFGVVEANVLDTDFSTIISPDLVGKTKLIGNLPYYISTAILQKLAVDRRFFSSNVLMLQREVVDRITARPGSGDRGFLTVITEAAFEVNRLFDVPPTAFTPQPKVWSSVISLTPKPPSTGDSASFRRLVSIAFAQKRKTIFNNLKSTIQNAADVLESAGIDPRRRAETLTLEEWFVLEAKIGEK